MKTNAFLGKQHQQTLTLPPWPQELTHDMRTTHRTAVATNDSRGHSLSTDWLAYPPKMDSGDTEVVDMGSTSHMIPTHGESGRDELAAAGNLGHREWHTNWALYRGQPLWHS